MFKKALFLICMILFSTGLLIKATAAKDLKASLANLPGLADSADKGAFVDLVKAMDDVYTEGKIKIDVYPFARSIDNVLSGNSDFHIPMMKVSGVPESKLPYRFVKEKIGTVYFVVYSHSDKPLTKSILEGAISGGGQFPYKIEAFSTVGKMLGFPTLPSVSIDQSLKKVQAKRIDGAIYAQEEGDTVLKGLKIKEIHRILWKTADDCIVISRSADADKLDKTLSDLLISLRKSGRLEKIYLKVHKTYNNWQPVDMGW